MRLFRFYISAIALLLGSLARAQEVLPFVENFTKADYKGDNQNWNVIQGRDNAMYFANNHYLLRYNGVKWEKYTLPNNTIIRSLFSEGDRIYCGSYKEFGYWKRIDGRMKYFSLSAGKKLFEGKSGNEEIWKVFKYDGKLYFQSFNELFIVYGSGKIQKLRLPYQISYCYIVGTSLYAASVREGVFVIKNDRFERKEGWESLKGQIIHHLGAYNGQVYAFTRTGGVFVEHNGRMVSWENPLNARLFNEVILDASFIGDKLVIGTSLEGIYLVDMARHNTIHINRKNALGNNAVLSMCTDKEKDIWLGLDNGIAHIEVHSDVRLFSDNSGILGSVYALQSYEKGYLIASNHGLFTLNNGQLNTVGGIQGQAWDIFKDGNDYIIGHNDGTFIFNAAGLKKVNDVSGGWKLIRSNYEPVFFQAHYAGVTAYSLGSKFSNPKELKGLTKPIRNIVQERAGELWAADNYRGLYRLDFLNNGATGPAVTNVTQENSIKNDYGVKLFKYKGKAFFLADDRWFTYNPISGKLEKDKYFNAHFSGVSDALGIDDLHFLILKDNLLYLISSDKQSFTWHLIPQKYYEGRLITDNIKVYRTGNEIVINLDDGFFSCSLSPNPRKDQKITIEAYSNNQMLRKNDKVKYDNPVEITVSPEFYGYSRPELFYTLNGKGAYQRIGKGNLTLNNLGSGQQEFEVYIFTGTSYKKVASYTFKVAWPWYFSIWMIIVYAAVLSALLFLYFRYNKLRYQQMIRFKEEEMRHERNILEVRLKAENQQRMQEYQRQILELEIQTKSSEVAGKSLSIAKQSEIIEKIDNILKTEQDADKIKAEIKKVIRINEMNKHEWETFESNLGQLHSPFIKALNSKFPNLSPKDIKLCIYLRMNLSSKEIAPLMNISFRSVELQRYRLRKKLNLPPDENLTRLMLSI